LVIRQLGACKKAICRFARLDIEVYVIQDVRPMLHIRESRTPTTSEYAWPGLPNFPYIAVAELLNLSKQNRNLPGSFIRMASMPKEVICIASH
jgi:hypothetical protein